MTPLSVIISPKASDQIDALEMYIAEHSYPERAYRYIRRLLKFCMAIGIAPGRGRNLDAILPGLRCLGFERRINVYFRVVSNRVIIAGIYYGGSQPQPGDFD